MRVKVRGTCRVHVRTSLGHRASLAWLRHYNVVRCFPMQPHNLKAAHDGWCARQTPSDRSAEWQTKRFVSSFFALHSCLFMSGCMYSRDVMASCGDPIHILFAPCNERAAGTNQRCWWHDSGGGRGPQPTCSFWSATFITASRCKCNNKPRPFL